MTDRKSYRKSYNGFTLASALRLLLHFQFCVGLPLASGVTEQLGALCRFGPGAPPLDPNQLK